MHDMDDIAREFIAETSENLNQADWDMVALESNPEDRDLLSRIFRTVHTIKGACGFLGFADLGSLAHNAESLLGLLRDGKLTLSEEIVSAILDTLDNVRKFVASLEGNGATKFQIDQTLVRRLASFAERRRERDPSEIDVTPQGAPPDSDQSRDAPGFNTRRSSNTLRVRVELIDELMNLVGELVLAKSRLVRVSGLSDEAEFADSLQCLTHVTDALQEGIMKTRMQPMIVAWGGIPRLVRDLAMACGKKVDVRLEGGDTELDRSVIEAIKDPLIHLVRNVVDHGIESPEERLAAGKPEFGTLRLHAYHEGGEINLEVLDNGRGFDVAALRARAIAAGVTDEEHASHMTVNELHRLAFQPGVSTATEVSAVSGRGVGMDVVRTNIEALGGVVDLHSTAGVGTRTRIKIPLTLAIVPAITVVCRSENFAIPQIYLQEFVSLESDQGSARVEQVQGTPVCRLRDQLFPLLFLDEVLGIRQRSNRSSRTKNGQLVVLNVGGNLFGLVVDDIGAPEEIVVKPLPSMIRDIPIFSGAAVVGGGQVALILDVMGLAQQHRIATASKHAADPSFGKSAQSQSESHIFVELGAHHRVALPITSVERLETIQTSRMQNTLGGVVYHQGAEIVPIHDLGELLGIDASNTESPSEEPTIDDPVTAALREETDTEAKDSIRLIVCRHHAKLIALRVTRIIDIVSDLTITPSEHDHAISLGTAIIDDFITDVVDPLALLDRAWGIAREGTLHGSVSGGERSGGEGTARAAAAFGESS